MKLYSTAENFGLKFQKVVQNNFLLLRVMSCLLLLLSIDYLYSQEPLFSEDWRWSHFTTESGLPSNNILQIVETTDSTIWVNTTEGLAWFDGYEFKSLTSQKISFELPFNIKPSINNNILVFTPHEIFAGNQYGFSILKNSRHSLYVEPYKENTYLFCYGDSLYVFEADSIFKLANIPPQIQGSVTGLWRTMSGSLWMTNRVGIYKFIDSTWELLIPNNERIFTVTGIVEKKLGEGALTIVNPPEFEGVWEWKNNQKPVFNNKIEASFTNSIDIGPQGDIITIGKNGEIRTRENDVWKTVTQFLVQIKRPKNVYFSMNGNVWIGSETGLFLYKRQKSLWSFGEHIVSEKRNMINDILVATDSSIWLATADGIVIQKPDGSKTWINEILGKKIFGVTGIGQDINGNIWIGSGSTFSGTYCWDGSKWKSMSIGKVPDETYVHKIEKDNENNLWFLCLSKNFLQLSKQPGIYLLQDDSFLPWFAKKISQGSRIYSFAEDKNKVKWLGTIDGLIRWKQGILTRWNIMNSIIKKNRVFSLETAQYGQVWFGDQEGGSGLGFVANNDSLNYFTTRDGLVNNNVWDLAVDSSGVLWIATERGLGSYHDGEWRTYDERSGLKYPFIWPIVPRSDKVYVGTLGGGLAILDRTIPITPGPRIKLDQPLIEESKSTMQWKAFAFNGELSPNEVQTRFRLNDENWSPWNTQHSVTYSNMEPGNYHFYVQARGVFGQYDSMGKQIFFTIQPPFAKRPIFIIPIGLLSLLTISFAISYFVRKNRTDAALRRSEERFRTITETSHSAIFIFSDSRLHFVNSEACRLTQYSQELLLENSFESLLSTENLKTSDESNPAFVPQPGNIKRFEGKIHCADGSDRWADFILGSITFEGKLATIATAFDITERKHAELQLLRYQQQLRSLTAQLSITEEHERRKMATHLHDSIGATLAFCKIKLGELQETFSSDTNLTTFREIRDTLSKAIQDTRSLTVELSPPILYELGIVSALEWLVEKIMTEHHISYSFQDDKLHKLLEDEVKVMVFHSVRELLVNIVKHAHATSVIVTTKRKEHFFEITICDNGVGFDYSAVLNAAKSKSWSKTKTGFGLFNIRERISHLGGETIIQTKDTLKDTFPTNHEIEEQRGTTIVLRIPLSHQ